MISRLIQKKDQYFCSNCMMRQPHIIQNCFWCGNIFSNYEDMLIQDVNDHARALLDIDPETGRDRNASNETFKGMRAKIDIIDDSPFISKEEIEKLITEMKVKSDESNVYGRD